MLKSTNEDIKMYLSGSPEKKSLKAELNKLENQHFKYYWRHVIKLRNNRALIENNESGRQNPSLQCTSNLLAVLKEGLSEKKYDLLENNILNYERHRNRFVESNLKLVLFMSKNIK